MTAQSSVDDTPLGLRHVLASSLPTSLGSPGAPDRYTVEAVFDRRPSREEIALVTGTAMRDALTAAGYPTIELKISDRRLEIANTNLAELREGLATALADQIGNMSEVAIAVRADHAAALLKSTQEQAVRAIAIVAMAASITFDRSDEQSIT